MGERLNRFIRLLLEHPQGLKATELAQRLGVSRTHIYRLRDRAQELGYWVATHEDLPGVPRGYLRLDLDATPPPITLTWAEAQALREAVERFRPLSPLAEEALKRLMEPSLRASSPEPVLYSPLLDEFPPGLYEKVAEAIRKRRTAIVTYQNAKGEVKTYPFDPYILIARDPHLYLVGANHRLREAGLDPVHELRLDQIQAFKLTPHRFPRPNFDVRAYVRGRFKAFAGEGPPLRVRVRFSPEKAGFIRRTRRHPTQRTEDLPDGGVIWEVEVPLSEDLVHFILGYGPHAQVLEPEALRARVVAWAQGALEANLSPEGATKGA